MRKIKITMCHNCIFRGIMVEILKGYKPNQVLQYLIY